LKWYNLLSLLLLGTLVLGCARYDYYPRGIHQSAKKVQGKVNSSAYIVKKGDTLYSIGKHYNIDYHQLAKRNGIKKPYVVYVGQRVYTQGFAPVAAHKSKSPRTKLQRIKFTSHNEPGKLTKYPPASRGNINLVWPAKGALSSRFGPRENRMHDGIDIGAKEGTPIYAAAAGEVVYSDDRLSGYGKLVIVRHSSDMFTAYAHNQRNLVRKGDRVKAGAVIASVGRTGRASGPHLHFEVRRGPTPVDPLVYLPRR